MSSLGARIAFARKLAGVSQVDLAMAAGVRQLALSQWEHDRTVPRTNHLVAMAQRLEAVGCTVEWLATGTGAEPRASSPIEAA